MSSTCLRSSILFGVLALTGCTGQRGGDAPDLRRDLDAAKEEIARLRNELEALKKGGAADANAEATSAELARLRADVAALAKSRPPELLSQTGEFELKLGQDLYEVYYRLPYASPPNLKLENKDGYVRDCQLLQQTDKGFKVRWRRPGAGGGDMVVRWRAEGLAGK